ncbi:hypothetical protein ARMSODRAFT_1022921 [Armillaria solidipes]|uniref:Uncharacterized protein n=1 Tax=Armillaria solidipes TaxID=1076256 RepID=A0A2H3B166_9AGAR|nr:hypothetical protein ARMSODRAFT_1022921 [Armillaria solidipes]
MHTMPGKSRSASSTPLQSFYQDFELKRRLMTHPSGDVIIRITVPSPYSSFVLRYTATDECCRPSIFSYYRWTSAKYHVFILISNPSCRCNVRGVRSTSSFGSMHLMASSISVTCEEWNHPEQRLSNWADALMERTSRRIEEASFSAQLVERAYWIWKPLLELTGFSATSIRMIGTLGRYCYSLDGLAPTVMVIVLWTTIGGL